MQLSYNTSDNHSVYINGNYVTIADNASSTTISLEPLAVFNTMPDMSAYGLVYDTLSNPRNINGDPDGFMLSPFTINVQNFGGSPEDIFLEVIRPRQLVTRDACGCIYSIADTTVINNPAIANRGQIRYEVFVDNQWISIGTIGRGGTLLADLCCFEPGTFDLRATLTIRQIPNCGGTSPVVFVATSTQQVTVEEYLPTINIAASEPVNSPDNCCKLIVGEETTVYPSIDLNRPIFGDFNNDFNNDFLINTCVVQNENGNSVNATIRWSLYDHDSSLVESVEYSITDETDLVNDLIYQFTPQVIGGYKVVAEVSTCCGTTKAELILEACNYITINNVCHTTTVSNSSLSRNAIVTLYKRDNVTIMNGPTTLLPNQSLSYNTVDGVYIVKVVAGDDTFYQPIIDHCGIRECLADFIRPILCEGSSTKNNSLPESRFILNKMIAIGTSFFNIVTRTYHINNLYTALDTNTLTDLFDAEVLLGILKKYCDSECRDKQNMEGGCGCS